MGVSRSRLWSRRGRALLGCLLLSAGTIWLGLQHLPARSQSTDVRTPDVQFDARTTVDALLGGILSGNLSTDNAGGLVVEAPVFTVYLDQSQPSATVQDAVTALVQLAFKATNARLRIESGTLRIFGSGQFPIVLNSLNAALEISSNGERISGEGTFEGPDGVGRFELSTVRGGLNELAGSLKLEGPGLDFSFAGAISRVATPDTQERRLVGNGALVLASANLARTFSAFGLSERMPGLSMPGRIEGTAEISGGVVAVQDGEVAIGSLQSQGFVSLDVNKSPAKIDATLAFDELDATELLAHVVDQSTQFRRADADGQKVREASTPLETTFEWLDRLNLDARLSATRVVAGTVEAGPLALTIVSRRSKLFADVAELEIDGGLLTGQLQLALDAAAGSQPIEADAPTVRDAQPAPDDPSEAVGASQGRFAIPNVLEVDDTQHASAAVLAATAALEPSVRTDDVAGPSTSKPLDVRETPSKLRPLALKVSASVDGVDLGPLLVHAFDRALLTGLGNAELQISGSGTTFEALIAQLKGTAQIDVGPSGEMGLDLVALAEAVQETSVEGLPEAAQRPFPFGTFSADVVLRGGTIFSQRMAMTSGDRLVTADGTLNLPKAQLYVRVDQGVLATDDTGAASTLVIRGPLERPVVHLEAAGAPPPALAAPALVEEQ